MLKLFALLAMTFMMVSCGGGKATATLSITRGMVLANTSFSGGIYITGEKVGGTETFSATITSGNQASVTIPFGNWNFKVIGWDGGGVMGGTAYCKYLPNYAFTTEGQQLEITTTASECFIANISGGNQQVTPNVGPWKNLVINTCGSLANPSATNDLTVLGYFNPCTQGNYDIEYRKTHPYYKVVLVNQTIAGIRTAGASSACLTANTPNTVIFPNRMPVTVKFFADGSCTKEIDEFRFSKGLDWSLSPTRATNDFDWQVTADSVNFFVTLANGASKRGTSAFHTETPVFKCKDGSDLIPCTKFPVPAPSTYYVDPGVYAVIKVPQTYCGSITFPDFPGTSYSCDVVDGFAYIGFKTVDSYTIGRIGVNGTMYDLVVGNNNTGYDKDRVRDAYKTLKRALGYRNNSSLNDSLQDDFDEGDNEKMGFLDPAIYEISSMGAGGSFYDYYTQCSTGALAQVSRSYVKKGINYTVHLSGIAENAPAFTARSEEPEFMGSEVHYNRRLIVKKLVGPSYVTEKVIDFSCDNFDTDSQNYVSNAAQVRNGRMEEQRSYSYGISPANKLVTLKKKIFWNTSSSDTARFDIYRTKNITNSTGTNQKIERNFYRVAKSDSDAFNDFKIHSMNYEVVRDGSSYDETINVHEIDGSIVSGVVSYSHKRLLDLKLDNTTIGNIFTTGFAAELNEVRYGYRPNDYEAEQTKVSTSGADFIEARRGPSNLEVRFTDSGTIQTQTISGLADNIATDISNNGVQKIVVTNTGTSISYIISINGVTSTATFSAASTPVSIKAAILDNGTFAVAFLEPGSFQKLRWIINGGAIYDSPFTTYVHKSIDMTKDTSMIYLMHTRTNSTNTEQRLDICRMNGSQSCGFNTIASKISGSPFTYASITAGPSNIYFTYIHDTLVHTLNVDSPTLLNVSTPVFPSNYSFSPYEFSFYTNLNESNHLRSAAGTAVDIHYPYFNPTISGFEMKPIMLNNSTMNGIFTTNLPLVSN